MNAALKNYRGLSARILILILLCAGLAFSCATSQGSEKPAPKSPDVFKGTASSDSLLKALNGAKMDAVKALVVAELGVDTEKANHDTLQQVLYGTNNPNQFVVNETLNVTRKDNTGTIDNPNFVVEVTVKVNRQVVENVLKTNGIGVPAKTAQTGSGPAAASPSPAGGNQTAAQTLAPQASDSGSATDAQKAFIRKYVDKLTYLVYFADTTTEKDQFLLKAAVTQANSYLTSNAYTSIDAAQVEKLKKDDQKVWIDQTGGDMSIIQWIAQSLNADIYLELDASTTSEARGGNYYGQAIITVKMYDTSTGQLLGSQPYTSPKTMSKVDQTDAVSNALQSSVWAVMPIVIDQSKTLLAKQMSNGIHYELKIQKAADARMMSDFRRKLQREKNVSDVSTRSQSGDQAVLDVFFYGKADDLVDTVFDAAKTVTGLENIDLVLQRGKSLTFTSGL